MMQVGVFYACFFLLTLIFLHLHLSLGAYFDGLHFSQPVFQLQTVKDNAVMLNFDLQSIRAQLLIHSCTNNENFYRTLGIHPCELTKQQSNSLLHLHKLICIAHCAGTIKFKAERLALQLMLLLVELDTVEDNLPLRVCRLLLSPDIVAQKNLYRTFGINPKHLSNVEIKAFKRLRQEVVRAHYNKNKHFSIATHIETLTIKTLLLIHNANHPISHPRESYR